MNLKIGRDNKQQKPELSNRVIPSNIKNFCRFYAVLGVHNVTLDWVEGSVRPNNDDSGDDYSNLFPVNFLHLTILG